MQNKLRMKKLKLKDAEPYKYVLESVKSGGVYLKKIGTPP